MSKKEEGLLPIGTLLFHGKYKIEKHLSSGGFGKTYLAIDTAFNEKVAIKELYIKGVCGRNETNNEVSVSLTENKRAFEAQQEKFRKEAYRLRKLDNAHIVKVHDLFDDNNTSYYVMDYIEGESLSALVKRTQQPMSEEEAMSILHQVMDALEVVHAQGIWHLDIKPGNIMFDKEGNALLIDFGASKQLRNSSGDSLSTSSALAYTRGYAPSEQMEQKFENFGPWTDIYALGGTLYHLLTLNDLPTPSEIDEDVNEALPFTSAVSQKTQDLIRWMMTPKRTNRPQSIEAIREFLSQKPVPSEEVKEKVEEKVEKKVEKKVVDEDDPTELKFSHSEKKDVTIPRTTKQKSGKSSIKLIMFGSAIVFFVLAFIAFGKCGKAASGSAADSVQDTTAVASDADAVEQVTDYKIDASNALVDPAGNNMAYKYTGPLHNGKPDGEGKAVYENGSTYQGHFSNGYPETDNGYWVFSNGDNFTGKISKGYFVKGAYTSVEAHQVFKGTFEKGQPAKGVWTAI